MYWGHTAASKVGISMDNKARFRGIGFAGGNAGVWRIYTGVRQVPMAIEFCLPVTEQLSVVPRTTPILSPYEPRNVSSRCKSPGVEPHCICLLREREESGWWLGYPVRDCLFNYVTHHCALYPPYVRDIGRGGRQQRRAR